MIKSMTSNLPPAVNGLGSVIPRYDLILCDLWGVMHNGVHAIPGSNEACSAARAAGATVIMISNAPRPGPVVAKQIEGYGVLRSSYDDVIASGDVTRDELISRPGAKVFHLGPQRDLPNYQGLNLSLVDFEHADLIVCTGPFNDENDKPEDYRDLLMRAKERELTLICANPDIVVERGNRLVWCAGAVAAIYDEIGGETIYAGKPHPQIYRMALTRAQQLRGKPVDTKRVLAVGDGLRTDIRGGAGQGFDTLFIARGIHAADFTREDGGHDSEQLLKAFKEVDATPTAIMREFVW
jgi:HAD superfamily hydrolase (TIGR01459 family)